MPETPKPNTLAVSWFYGENQKNTLPLTQKYQHNPIWSIGQKCFLIDSLIFGCPIPQVYISIKTKTEGLAKEKKTIYEVVDGQQRLRAILEFMNDEWPLIETTAKSYPVSDLYKRHIWKKYSELPDSLQNVIWDYPLAVQELRGKEEKEIQALFRRLNYVVERLNSQELRHSQYFGEFNDAVQSLTKEQFWDEINLFTRRDSQRMKDMEFISELFVIVVEGVQDGQKTLDKFYADYDVVFPQKSKAVARFNQVVAALQPLPGCAVLFQKLACLHNPDAAVLAEPQQILIARDDELRPGFQRAFQDAVVVRVFLDGIDGVLRGHETSELGKLFSCEVQPVPLPREVVTQHGHEFIQNRVRNVDAEHPGAGHAEKASTDAAKFQSRHVNVGIEGDSEHSAPLERVDSAPILDDFRHIGYGIAGLAASLQAIGQEVLPGPLLKTFPQGFLGQFIDSLALGLRLCLQLGQQLVGHVNVVLGCHGAL